MRPWVVHLVTAAGLALGAAGCLTTRAAEDGATDAPTEGCVLDEDCALAGPSCCACPTHAVPVGSAFADACDGVMCPSPATCSPLVARCSEGACVAACAPVTCDLSCAAGFVADAAGCLRCECAPTTGATECTLDSDCARAPADCCGCEHGGAETAVPVAQLGQHLDALMCAGDEACPGVSTCTAGTSARCQLGRCVLVGPTTDPGPLAGACGRPELPPCPVGQVCVINQAGGANPLGVGVCQPAP